MRKKQEEEKRIKELEAARNDYVSHRANADERNKALVFLISLYLLHISVC